MKIFTLTCGIAAIAATQAFGAIGYIDMGHRDNDLQGTVAGGVTWSTFGWQTTPDSNVSILDSVSGLATGWIIDVANIEGDSPNSDMPAGHIFKTADATTDGVWNRPDGVDQRMVITISGLDDTGAETYNLSLYGNRSNSDDAAANFHVQGAGPLVSSGTILQGNTSGTNTPWDILGVQADGSGEIVIEMQTPATYDLAIISAMSIESVPEPSSAALLGLGGLALILRRRK